MKNYVRKICLDISNKQIGIQRYMDAQKPPIDISVTLGKAEGHHNLLKVDFFLQQGQDKIKQFLGENKIDQNLAKDFAIVLDYYVEAGREKQAIEYFKQTKEEQFSPLQVLTRYRPEEGSEKERFSMEEHTGFIRLIYWMRVDYEDSQIVELNENLQALENNDFDPSFHASFDIKGFISHNKKNRTNVKVDYAKFDLVSHAYQADNAWNALSCMEAFSSDIAQLSMNPMITLVKRSKQSKVELKMDSFRKIKKYYSGLSKQDDEGEAKQFNYVNRGIFRKKATAAVLYHQKYLMRAEGNYESEDVFIRLLKVYSKFIQKAFSVEFY